MKSFKRYLEDVCFELYPEILDDEMPDFFEDWLEEKELDLIIAYAEKWHTEQKLATLVNK